MEKEFGNLKNHNPYKVPDGFFETITTQTLAEAKKREYKSKTRKIYVAVSVAASLLVMFLAAYFMNFNKTPKEHENIAEIDNAKIREIIVDTVQTKSSTDKKNTGEGTETLTKKEESIENLMAEMSDEELELLVADLNEELFVTELTND